MTITAKIVLSVLSLAGGLAIVYGIVWSIAKVWAHVVWTLKTLNSLKESVKDIANSVGVIRDKIK